MTWLADTYGLAGEPLFFGKDSGWVLGYRRSGRSLVTLLPRVGEAGALVVVGPSIADEVAAMPLSPVTREALAGAHAYPDGRWLWLTLASDDVAVDIERLVARKSPPPRRPRRPAGPPERST